MVREYNGVKGERLWYFKLRGQVSQGLLLRTTYSGTYLMIMDDEVGEYSRNWLKVMTLLMC